MTSTATTAPAIDTTAFSHGTLECRDGARTQEFYREFLGLKSIRMSNRASYMWLGGDWLVACLVVGDLKLPQAIENRFMLHVESNEEVDAAYQAALDQREKWQIKTIRPIEERDGERSFCLEDLDENWWEIARRPSRLFDDKFAKGNEAA